MGSEQPVGLNCDSAGPPAGQGSQSLRRAHPYRQPAQPSIDGNTVDMDVERSQFIDNAIRYQFALDRVEQQDSRTLDLALRGQ